MKAEKAAKQRLQKEGRAAKLKASKSATKIASRAANKTPPFADSTNLESRSTQRRHSIVVSPMVAHPPNKRRKDSKNEPSPEEMQLLSDSHSLRQRIIEDSRRLISMQKEMKKMKQKRRKNNNQEAGIVESKSTVIPAGTTLYYIIFGLAGKVVTGSSGIIFAEELINGLIGSPPGRDDVKSDALRA